jgi:cobalt-zinc-cadmium efflux system outer membrane protein
MMREGVLATTFVALLTLPVTVRAQAPAAQVPPADVDALVALALKRAPELSVRDADIAAAEGDVRQADVRQNPMLMSRFEQEPRGSDRRAMFGLSVPIAPGARRARVDVARAMVDELRAVRDDRARLVERGVRSAAGRVLLAERRLQVLTQQQQTIDSLLTLVAARVAQGAGAALDEQLLRVERERIEIDITLATGERDVARAELSRAVGVDESDLPQLTGDLETEATRLRSLTDVAVKADVQRADIRAAVAAVTVADARRAQVAVSARPELRIEAQYMVMDAAFPQFGFSAEGVPERIAEQFHYVTAGVSVELPWFDRQQGRRIAADAALARARAQERAVRLDAQAERTAAEARDRRSRQAIDAFRTRLLPLAARNLETMREAFVLGRLTMIDVITERRRYEDMLLQFAEALGEAYQITVANLTARAR